MPAKITRDVIESYLNCKYKGFLKHTGQAGVKSDFENLLIGAGNEVRFQAIDKILVRHSEGEIARNIPLTASALKQGPLFILDATLEDDRLSLGFDGMKKVPGASKLGDFHYIPTLFHESRQVRKEQRLLLEIYGLLLARLQGRTPGVGIIWHGKECKATKVRLNPDLRRTERLLDEIKQAQGAEPPRLLLNDHCQVCEFRQRCQAQAIREDNLSLLRGMGEKEIKNYARKGITTVMQLALTFRPRRKGKRPERRCNRYHALEAIAIRDKRIYVFGTPELPAGTVQVYLDMEGNPEEGAVYLIGMIVVKEGQESRYSFWADSKDEESKILDQLLSVIAGYEDYLVFCYGGYERAFLKRMRKQCKRKKVLDKLLKAVVNTLSLVYSHFYFPTYSNGLKDVAKCLGYSWTDEDASGIQSIVWRRRWEDTHEESWKEKLTTYNLEDCAALKLVTELIYAVPTKPRSTEKTTSDKIDRRPAVVRVQDIDKLATPIRWGRVNFFHADYEYINNCAYFDYQRDRVYVRTSKTLRRNHAKNERHKRQTPRVGKRFEIISPKCPFCGSPNLERKPRKKRSKIAFDLVITAGGIRRKVIRCVAVLHWCLACGERFIPEKYQRLDRHFHGLKSWAIFEHVAHQTSFRTIHENLQEYFGLRIHHNEVYGFKSLMAWYYRETYRTLLKKVLSGKVLHIDETEVKLKTGKGYIWAFTTLEEAVYIYRPTREGDFLQELLKDFHGVLVSDFYVSYDAIDCPQQKCLIHLMRDINQELLNSPYDEELQSVTRPFGTLLRAIVATVDQYGLRKKHLHCHEKEVKEFFRQLSAQSFRSEAAEALRQRLLKYQDKLFTFIQHDGVPWNNNNAENAIRRFAYYREGTVGIMKEPGLKGYLLLLSIYQTCRYKGVSFLQFLLSRERNMDRFCERKRRRRRRQPDIEVYPKGIIPPHLASLRKQKSDKHSTDALGENSQTEAQERTDQAILLEKSSGQPSTSQTKPASTTEREGQSTSPGSSGSQVP